MLRSRSGLARIPKAGRIGKIVVGSGRGVCGKLDLTNSRIKNVDPNKDNKLRLQFVLRTGSVLNFEIGTGVGRGHASGGVCQY